MRQQVGSLAATGHRIGKDHFMLADWRISVATYEQRRKDDGTNIDFAEYAITRGEGIAQKVTLEAPSTVGLPTAADEDLVIGLLAIAKEQGFASDVVRFVPSRLLRIMGLTDGEKNYARLKHALKRLRAVTITYEQTWYSRKTQAVEPILITGILAEAKLVLRRGRRTPDSALDCYVQWTRHFYTSLQEGNLTDLDLDLYFDWHRPGAKHLHRHLNKVWHAGRRPKLYERDLRELACGHLGMTYNKDLKRNFQQIVAEMEQHRYLTAMEPELRYRKVRPGVWRVRLELHPDQARGELPRTKTSGEGVSKVEGMTEAAALVNAYHRRRFEREGYVPKANELKHAQRLIDSNEPATLNALIDAVAGAVQSSYQGRDHHFGAAVPFFEHAVEEDKARRDRQDKQTVVASQQSEARRQLTDEEEQRRTMKKERLAAWQKLPADMRAAYFEQAVQRSKSNFTRARLRHANLNDPPAEVLAEMATHLKPPR